MSRSKKDWNDTAAMLARLERLLIQHARPESEPATDDYDPQCRADAESLRRISMTLHRWHELECGDGNDHGSWCITRGRKERKPLPDLRGMGPAEFVHDDDGSPFLEHHHYRHGAGKDSVSYSALPDREVGAKKRLASIMARYSGLQTYIQTDPRGCALYILKPGDVPEGADISAYYSRGLAVFK